MGATGTLRYSYDAAGLLSSQTDTATGETVTYAYDRAGRRILMAGAGRETAYRYGRNGELLEVSDNRQRLSVSYKYDVMGRETERIFGNGVSQHTAYDKAGRVILITEKSGNNILLRGEGYVYDSLGRRSATVSHSGAVTRYEYNPAGQLAKVQYPDSQELRDLQEKEARQHGLFWQEGVSGLSNGHLSTGEYTELSRLLVRMRNGSGFLPTTQVFRTEMYTYDANGNRATKTTAYGTITYSYDAENRLVKTCGNTGVGVEYAYDNNGNLLSQTGSLKHSIYEYNPQNRMVRLRVVDDEARTIASTRYGYDVLGRRTLVQDKNATTLRTLYDGLGFDVVKESPVYANGGFVDTYNTGIQYSPAGRATGERYRYLDDGVSATSEKYQYIEDSSYQTVSSRYSGERTMLYAHGSPVAINRSGGTRGYLGTDILGSTRSVTDNHGVQESFYDYDIFGSPITGNYTTGADYGYLGKPYDSITGLYNYGYRDYSPQTVRFTTVDPIRDGANWFTYVNNDPVNYVDLWGLLASEPEKKFIAWQPESPKIDTVYHTLIPSQNKKESFFYQDKESKMLWSEATFIERKGENSADMLVGVLSVSSELNDKNNTPFPSQGQFDLITASFNFSATDGGMGAGFSVNIVSVSGKIGIQFPFRGREVQVLIGGAAGLTTGMEIKVDTTSGIVLDVGAILKPRIEINWEKELKR